MASTPKLRRYRTGFLVLAILAFVLTAGLFALRPAALAVDDGGRPPPVAGNTPGPIPQGHEHAARPPAPALRGEARPQPHGTLDVADVGAVASLCTTVIALLGFLVTSIMTVRKERRDSALFAIELEAKRLQLAEMQARIGQAARDVTR